MGAHLQIASKSVSGLAWLISAVGLQTSLPFKQLQKDRTRMWLGGIIRKLPHDADRPSA